MARQLNEYDKTSISTKILYGAGIMGGNVVSVLLATFMLPYYTDTALMGMASVSTMLFLTRLPDGITDILMGGIVDKTNTRWGKCRPWLLAAAPLITIGIILVVNVPMGWSGTGKLVYAYITYTLLTCIAYTIFGIASTSLLARLTLDTNDRTAIVSVGGLFNNSTIIFGAVIVPAVMNIGWPRTSVILGLAAGLLILIMFLGVKEKVGIDADTGKLRHEEPRMKEAIPAVLKNKYFWLILFIGMVTILINASAIGSTIFYVNNIIGEPGFTAALMSVGQLPGLIMLILLPFAAPRISKRWFMVLGCAISIIGFFIQGIADGDKTIVLIGTIVRGIGFGPLFAGQIAFIADITDYGEWKTGLRTEGLMSATQSFGSKIGIGLGTGIAGWVIAAGGYAGGAAEQTEAAKSAINFAFGWLGCILSAVLLALIFAMNVEKYMPQVRAALEKKYLAEKNKGE
ncbi:MAG: glycoside-pentoside-hexuronide (GPH):cation symporter [Treponema sp.]|jgi:GPH family glycoside/pentoside/hexuronide:cation symporter|nr:glycoside-pentoside-hexuronide (GPH):cation symporter [Treponema sp.]